MEGGKLPHYRMCLCSWYVIQLNDRAVHVLEQFVIGAEVSNGGRICGCRSAVFRLMPLGIELGMLSCLIFVTPRRHLAVNSTVTRVLAGGAAATAPEGGALAGPSASTSTSTWWAPVTM
jgi:hypothetical protein